MALPLIFLPPGMPFVTAQGHGVEISDQFDWVPALQGEGRKRRLFTASDRTVTVRWNLSEQLMQDFDEWMETTLDAGTRQFTMPVAKLAGPGVEYWAAQWIALDTDEPKQSKNRSFWVSGTVRLTGEPSDTLPATGILALDTVVSLGGSAGFVVPIVLALDTVVSLGSSTGLALDTVVSLGTIDLGGDELRMDGGRELRMDGGLELRV